jgi:type II secretory pathway pseudopilin PulG
MKKKDQRKKRSVTLIEMIVVMLLIATIAGALAYNYQGSLNEGKAFKTKEGISRIKTILSLALAENNDARPEDVATEWTSYVQKSPLSGKSQDLLRDGWGKPYNVRYKVNENGGDDFEVTSVGLEAFERQKQQQPQQTPRQG